MVAVIIFLVFVGFLLWLSWFLGKKAKSADRFFIADGQIHWFINGIALTGGYLSAASFLGICGMIAFSGFDGYLYSIGFLSGWIIALFVVAEPLRKLGKYTFADALAARFKTKKIHLAASISTLVICLFYLIPQLVGAGVLIEPLLGVEHHWGVIIVGILVIVIVGSAGMSSTTYVQFIKASMLISFSFILVVAVLARGFDSQPVTQDINGKIVDDYQYKTLPAPDNLENGVAWKTLLEGTGYSHQATVQHEEEQTTNSSHATWVLLQQSLPIEKDETGRSYVVSRGQQVQVSANSAEISVEEREGKSQVLVDSWWLWEDDLLQEAQDITTFSDGKEYINGLPAGGNNSLLTMGKVTVEGLGNASSESIGPVRWLSLFAQPETSVYIPSTAQISYGGKQITLFVYKTVTGNTFMRPGGYFPLSAGNFWGRMNFISLMIALLFGTAALPHVLIRYYTVKDSIAARKSTIVAITAIGLFYILTLYLGLGAVANGTLNPLSDNMSAPLLARAFGEVMFAVITALAFATVLGTVSGLIVAASGAVANDLLEHFFQLDMGGNRKVLAARVTAVGVGVISIILGILFKNVNVGFLVGWAFAVAASANFPAIMLVLFWKRTTSVGIISSIFAGIVVSMVVIIIGPDMFELYGLGRENAIIPLTQPAIIAMPISMIVGIFVSLFTFNKLDISE
jgi:cation/acetate symporter